MDPGSNGEGRGRDLLLTFCSFALLSLPHSLQILGALWKHSLALLLSLGTPGGSLCTDLRDFDATRGEGTVRQLGDSVFSLSSFCPLPQRTRLHATSTTANGTRDLLQVDLPDHPLDDAEEQEQRDPSPPSVRADHRRAPFPRCIQGTRLTRLLLDRKLLALRRSGALPSCTSSRSGGH